MLVLISDTANELTASAHLQRGWHTHRSPWCSLMIVRRKYRATTQWGRREQTGGLAPFNARAEVAVCRLVAVRTIRRRTSVITLDENFVSLEIRFRSWQWQGVCFVVRHERNFSAHLGSFDIRSTLNSKDVSPCQLWENISSNLSDLFYWSFLSSSIVDRVQPVHLFSHRFVYLQSLVIFNIHE